MRVWIPLADAVDELAGHDVAWYDGTTEPPDPSDCELYVLPYTLGAGPLELMRHMPRLRVVQTLTAGYEHVLPYLPDGVLLANARGVHDASTAELAVALALASLRGLPEFVRAAEQGAWQPAFHPSLADKHVLIVGYGSIGEAVERRLAGFEVTVDRVARRARPGVHPTSALPDLLPRADVVILVTPLTAETRGLVDKQFLAALPDGALVVNVARGPVVDTDALLAEVSSGRLRAALDVTDPEPLPADHPLWSAPNVLISPHVGGASSAFWPRARRLVIAQVRRFLAGEALENVVHPG